MTKPQYPGEISHRMIEEMVSRVRRAQIVYYGPYEEEIGRDDLGFVVSGGDPINYEIPFHKGWRGMKFALHLEKAVVRFYDDHNLELFWINMGQVQEGWHIHLEIPTAEQFYISEV